MVKGSIVGPGGVKGLGGNLPGHVHFGIQGPAGGYYIPTIDQTDERTAEISYTPSKADMPPLDPVQIDLPTPQKGVDYYTEEDKTEMVNAVLDALPAWTPGSY